MRPRSDSFTSPRVSGPGAYALAVLAPALLTACIAYVPNWPTPYSWQYLGVPFVVALFCGTRPGLVALACSVGAVLWLGVPRPVHPGVEMFTAAGLSLLVLLDRWRRTEEQLRERVEALRRSEHAMRESTTLLRAISDGSSDMIFAKDLEGRFQFANPATLALVGKPREAVIGRTDVELLEDKEAARQVMQNDRRVMEGGVPTELEETVPLPDGTSRYWLSRKAPYKNADGEVIGLLGISRDITDRKQAEAALQDVNQRLRDADRRKNEFIAILSHELRNPLAAIGYALPAIEGEARSPGAARALEVIRRQADHLTRLVDDLLDVSRIAQGGIELRRERVALGSILKTAADAVLPAMAAARHEFQTDLPAEPIWVDVDADRLTQVLLNLLNNAAKYTPRGGRVVLSAGRDGGMAVIRVRDNGMGIPPESLSHVFDMFRQLDRSEDTGALGLGIGLGLSKRLVQLHDGSIDAHSEGPGHGAQFVVRLPIADPLPTGERPVPDSSARSSRGRLKVLVVDDNADLVEMLALVVEQEGHQVRKALDGKSAIAAALSFRPDVMLLDLGLPLLSGIDIARELRSRPELASMRLVALTGWGQLEDRQRTSAAGFDHHLTKPAEPQVVTKLLRDMAAEITNA